MKKQKQKAAVLEGNGERYVEELPSVVQTAAVQVPTTPLKLDFGCGSNKRQDNGPWTGVDSIAFPGVDVVVNLVEKQLYQPVGEDNGKPLPPSYVGYKPWPWADNSVAEAHASHFVEHLTGLERVHFINELWRVLVPGGKCQIITPHWASCRAYGDFTHQWPPVSEFWFNYLNREWRLGNPAKGLGPNAPHNDASFVPHGYNCNFDWSYGFGIHPVWQTRNQEAQQFAFQWYKESITDLIATITKAP